MKQMSPELFKEYAANPLAADEKVRAVLDLPDNRYYTVSMWPQEVAGLATNFPHRSPKGNGIWLPPRNNKVSRPLRCSNLIRLSNNDNSQSC